ncbi:MAG: hypothetical protein KDA60_00105 [Planctomycetales bacterium]|nr:hypothetical protein [Planctomycetales bacterium]
MTKLLVSVRDRHEALAAWQGGADVIDVKEPNQGALGFAGWLTVAEVLTSLSSLCGRQPLTSVACGELVDLLSRSAARSPDLPFHFAKVGLAGMASNPQWPVLWRQWAERLPQGSQPVAVAYADWRDCAAPSVDEVWDASTDVCRGLLIDTYHKQGQSLLDYLSVEMLTAIVRRADRAGRWVALAGSLSVDAVQTVAPCRPTYFAVRTAACENGRHGRVSVERVLRLRERLVKFSNELCAAERQKNA